MGCYLYNCTLTDNICINGNGSGHDGGGTYDCFSVNCIIYSNNAPLYPNVDAFEGGFIPGITNLFCCTFPSVAGDGNITNQPLFTNPYDFYLSAGSPCVDSGTNQAWMLASTDLDGHPRIFSYSVDIGADEAAISCKGVSLGQTVTTTWDTVVNADVRLESSTNLMATNWVSVGIVVTSVQETIVLTDPSTVDARKFYRLIWIKK